ncbi:hypothetical protein IE4771_PB00123 (plasmid) [Rhizobium etli bv. mimosae str. IE4771]|uniref:Uncharacterized protein n=1 Tax=Rhizobium etli bv. mimosae str. IE4771 TaxID=1432050 RepID=A0A060I7X3_RHIET|nr:hypothetical protein IE4771_PB00123 [Rhizobium sp. IE4771]
MPSKCQHPSLVIQIVQNQGEPPAQTRGVNEHGLWGACFPRCRPNAGAAMLCRPMANRSRSFKPSLTAMTTQFKMGPRGCLWRWSRAHAVVASASLDWGKTARWPDPACGVTAFVASRMPGAKRDI